MSKESLPDVSGIIKAATIAQLENELRRRGCAVAVITPEDVRSQWEVNQDADATAADQLLPTEAETTAALRLVQKYLDLTVFENEPAFQWGPASDACELIAAWRKEGESK